jgi:hypothetical protein
MRSKHVVLGMVCALVASASLAAQERPLRASQLHRNKHRWATVGRIENRDQREQERIRQGIASGALTAREGAVLERRFAKLQAQERIARSDGRLTWQERRRIEKKQDILSRQIYQQKHDRQRRWQAGR